MKQLEMKEARKGVPSEAAFHGLLKRPAMLYPFDKDVGADEMSGQRSHI